MSSNIVLAIIAMFVFFKYNKMSVDASDFIENQNSNIFSGDMIMCLLTVILVIIIERYCNRCDTKELSQTHLLTNKADDKFFS